MPGSTGTCWAPGLASLGDSQALGMWCCTMLHCAMWCRAVLCHVLLCHVLLRDAMLCHAVPCDAVPYGAMPYGAMPYHTVPCCIMPCSAVLPPVPGRFKLLGALQQLLTPAAPNESEPRANLALGEHPAAPIPSRQSTTVHHQRSLPGHHCRAGTGSSRRSGPRAGRGQPRAAADGEPGPAGAAWDGVRGGLRRCLVRLPAGLQPPRAGRPIQPAGRGAAR